MKTLPRILGLFFALGLFLRMVAIGKLAAGYALCVALRTGVAFPATAFFLYLLGRRSFTAKIAIGMAAAWCFYPAAILLTALPRPDTALLFLWLAALVIYDQLEARQFRLIWAIALGGILGLAILVAPVAVVLAASVLTYIGLIRYEAPAALRWRAVAAAFSVCLLLVLPARFAKLPPLFPPRAVDAVSQLAGKPSGTVLARLLQTDARLWIDSRPAATASGAIQPAPSASPWMLAIMAVPYMLIVGLGVSGFYLVRRFPERGLFLLQIFYGIVWLRAPAELGSLGHFPYMPALVVGAASLVRSPVWRSVPPWRRLFLLWTLGMLVGIWLNEALTLVGW